MSPTEWLQTTGWLSGHVAGRRCATAIGASTHTTFGLAEERELSHQTGARTTLSSGWPRASRFRFTAIARFRRGSSPSVQLDACGVIMTLSSSSKANDDGRV